MTTPKSSYRQLSYQKEKNNDWWKRQDLRYVDGDLFLGNQNLYELACSAAKPCYVYNSSRIKENILRLHSALESVSLPYRIFYAMKANRNFSVLTYIRGLGLSGVDCCSPQELILARQMGFLEKEITYTGTSVSKEDLTIIARHPSIFLNCDSLSQIRRVGQLNSRKEIGIRVNPKMGLSYADKQELGYSGNKTTKFGIYKDSFVEALKLANNYKLEVSGIHYHAGWGFLNSQLPKLEMVLNELHWFINQVPTLKYVNLGGGLGVPITQEDHCLDVTEWAKIIAKFLANRDFHVFFEPGDYIVKDAGLLLLQINTIERKGDTNFVYVNGGFNINLEPAFYQLPLEVVPLLLPKEKDIDSDGITVTIAGNINEAIDILATDIYLPPVQEGDFLAFLNAGGYGSSMSSNHCMRGDFMEYFIYNKS